MAKFTSRNAQAFESPTRSVASYACTMKAHLARFVLVVGSMLGVACTKSGDSSAKVDFATQIKPLLQDRCVTCHNDETYAGGLILQSKVTAFVERPSGPLIVPGDPAKSSLYVSLTLPDSERKAMPAMGHRISNAEVELIKRWIEQGAVWPEGEVGVIPAKKIHKGES